MEEHAQNLRKIFERLEQANFKIQSEKCVFATDTAEYLGHICTPLGIRHDPRKIQAIVEYPVPKKSERYSIIYWISRVLPTACAKLCEVCTALNQFD